MLLPGVVRDILMYGGGVLVAVALLSLWHSQRASSDDLPKARVKSRKADQLQFLLRWGRPLAILVGGALFFWAYVHNIEYVIVTNGSNGRPEAVRRYGYSDTPSLPLAPGKSAPRKDDMHDPVWVVNHSTRALRVETVQYGRGISFGNTPFPIPPNTAAHFTKIDHIGPYDRPPHEVRDEVNLGIAFREWLTWD